MRFWFVGILAIFLFASVSAAIDVNIAMVRRGTAANDANYLIYYSTTTPYFSRARDVNVIIDFNVLSPAADGNSVMLDINYSAGQAQGTDGNNAHVITNDLNLSAISATNSFALMRDTNVWCSSLTWSDRNIACHYYWKIPAGIADGNYYIKIDVNNNDTTDYNSSGIAIRIDNSAPVYGTDFNRFMRLGINNIYLDVNGYTEKDINRTGINVLDFNSASAPSRDAFVPRDSNIRIAIRINTSTWNSDANFTPITDVNISIKDFNSGMTCPRNNCNISDRNWMSFAGADANFAMTAVGDGNYYFDFNMGTFDTNFTRRYVRFITKDAAGNITDTNSSSDTNTQYGLILFSATYPSGFDASDANTTNLQDINNFAGILNMRFTTSPYGRVTFRSTTGIEAANVTDANKLRFISSYVSFTKLDSNDVRLSVDSVNFSDLNVTADINLFGLPKYNIVPGIRKIPTTGVDQNCGSVCSPYAYNSALGDMNITVSHFTSFETDANGPTTSEPSPSGSRSFATTTAISIRTNEQATCRYSPTDQNYDRMPSAISPQAVTHQWAASTPDTGAYTFYVHCRDVTDHNTTSSTAITFTLTSGGGGGTPPAGGGETPPAGDGTPSAPQPVITETGGQVTATLPAVTAAAPLTLDLSAYSTPISQIVLTASGNMSSGRTVQVKETTLSQETASPVSANGRIFKVMEIKMSSTINLKEAKLQFKIPKSWFTENQVDKDTVSLSRLVGETWVVLETSYKTSDASNEYFEATTPGFSLFAITGEKTVVSPPGPPTPEPTGPTPLPTGPTPSEGPLPPPQPQPFNWALPIIVLIIVVIAVGYYLTTRRRKKGL